MSVYNIIIHYYLLSVRTLYGGGHDIVIIVIGIVFGIEIENERKRERKRDVITESRDPSGYTTIRRLRSAFCFPYIQHIHLISIPNIIKTYFFYATHLFIIKFKYKSTNDKCPILFSLFSQTDRNRYYSSTDKMYILYIP